MNTKQTAQPAARAQPTAAGGGVEIDGPAIDLSEIPSVADLVKRLPALPPGGPADPETAARVAAAQWEAGEAQREALIFKRFVEPWLEAKAREVDIARFGQVRDPDSYPVPFSEFLAMLLPSERVASRSKIFTEFARSWLHRQQWRLDYKEWRKKAGQSPHPPKYPFTELHQFPMPSEKALDKLLGGIRKNGVSQLNWGRWKLLVMEFAAWYKAEAIKARNRAGGKAAQSKVKRKRKARPPREKFKAAVAAHKATR